MTNKTAKTRERKTPDVPETAEPKENPVVVEKDGNEKVVVETPTVPEGGAPTDGSESPENARVNPEGIVSEEVPAPPGNSKYETPNTPGERATRAYAELEERMKREAAESVPDYQKPIENR